MKPQIKAIPTEYRGIQFKSKSEAVFARNLDISRYQEHSSFDVAWEYEPEWMKTKSGWVPDFAIFYNIPIMEMGISFYIIEYKPSMPTKTYMETLGRNFDEVRGDYPRLPLCCFLVCGSPWKMPMRTFQHRRGDSEEWVDSGVGLFSQNVKEAAEYRFDLE